jgi:hypothetical protein
MINPFSRLLCLFVAIPLRLCVQNMLVPGRRPALRKRSLPLSQAIKCGKIAETREMNRAHLPNVQNSALITCYDRTNLPGP